MAIEVIAERYEVLRKLGHGGMGDVWLARDIVLDRNVAMKFVDQRQLEETPGAEEVLRDEARMAGKLLGQPQTVSVLDLREVQSDLHRGPAIIMEFLDGNNVAHWIAKRRPDGEKKPEQIRIEEYIAHEFAEALVDAHKIGILHRDIKPQNVLYSRSGRVKMADFGLARVVEELTRTHTVWNFNTALYAAPEQIQGERPSYESDVYQLSATIYHLFANAPANTGKGPLGVYRWHETDRPKSLIDHCPGMSAELSNLIMEGLSKKPENRPVAWRIFDSLTKSTSKPLRLHFDTTNCSQEDREDLRKLINYPEDVFVKDSRTASANFPDPLEGLRDALGTVARGGSVRLLDASESQASDHDDPDSEPV